ncbi:MAG: hypothetical protein M3487_08695 [Actinomycetota bacterium]|nr:hypothetical protein [Actinomycetota bacterium]
MIAVNERATKSARTRQRILDSAAAVFRQHGYANARRSQAATDVADHAVAVLLADPSRP